MSNLYILIGPPGSGKSTWAKQKNQYGQYIIISDDAMIYNLNGQNNNVKIGKATEFAKQQGYESVKDALKKGLNVIYDSTCFTKGLRKKLIKVGKKYKAKIIGIRFLDEPQDCLKRRSKKQNRKGSTIGDWQEMCYGFWLAFEEPSKGEGFDILMIYPDITVNGKAVIYE